ncbi:niemann-pick C1 protein precursor [Usnea florida]
MKHEEGRCAMRGQCGKKSFFGGELPCPDNGLAEKPDDDTRTKLVAICGDDWSTGDVCCDQSQVDNLKSNLNKVEGLISGCPACKANFYNLFCTFTCSPDQSLFVNVTELEEKSGKLLVTELDNLWSDEYGKGFYDSCKDVKFTGGKVMTFIGGGAKNYTSFLKFLGDVKPLGSPFQINFPRPSSMPFEDMIAADPIPKACNDTDEAYRCACTDCEASCPKLAKVTEQEYCHVGALPCLSFAVIVVYCVFLLLLVTAVSGHIAYQKHNQRKSERLQLLQDAALSDDEDEGEMVHNAGMIDRPQRQYRLNTICDSAFSHLGRMCARYPLITIGVSILIVVVLSIGWINFEVETNPVRLWVSPSSAAAKEKAFFDESFGPFYRAEQVFVVNDTHPSGPGPVLSYDTLAWWFDVEARVQRRMSPKEHVLFSDVCFNPTGDACVVQSITGYFGGSFSRLDPDTWQKELRDCIDQPVECLPDFQQPLDKDLILGGYEEKGDVLSAEAMIVTWVVNNHREGSKGEERALDWEEGLISVLKDAQREAREMGLRLSFSTERSLEEELNKSTNTDAKIVVISYIVMFLYASLALGSTTLSVRSILQNPANALVASKFTLGIIGIVIVLMSVSASVGLFSACGIKVTLIIAEVIPFLVLAVGVDNIFLIVHEFERVNVSHPDEEVETRIAKALGRMGPSILLSALTETIAFALGAAVGMPAVKNFAVYAAGAVLINALLQITMFVSVLALNQRRVEDSRADCFPFVKVKRADVGSAHGAGAYGYDDEGALQKFIRKVYAPFLLDRRVKITVVVLFLGLFTAGLGLIPEVALGLDQRIAFPRGSYLIAYFNDLDAYFNTGPPVYFVIQDSSVTQRPEQRSICGRFSTCQSYSLTNVLEQESKRPDVSFITGSTASWIDDFFTWLNPERQSCCIENGKTCFEGRNPPWNITLYGMPQGEEFIHYLTKWLHSPTDAECPYGGEAPYSTAVDINPLTHPPSVSASHFRTSHTPLRSQADFINAYASARRIASGVSEDQNLSVFPYSKFYIFFDQYASIIRLTGTLLGCALAIIFVLSAALLGSIATSLVITLTVAMIVVDVIGCMSLFSVSLNAISLVNLVICVGIGVEFCAHIARAFTYPSKSVMEKAKSKFRGRDLRAWTALTNVGGSVFSGITITKFLGVFVLAFTRSKIFEIYYFRIWLALVILAALHSLVWLPVALSLVGGDGYLDPESDGSLEDDLAARRYRALLPEDDYDSDDY